MSEPIQKEMTFWDHLDDLRKTIFRIGGFVGIASLVFFAVMKPIFNKVIIAPARGDFFLYQWLGELSEKFPFMPEFIVSSQNIKIININLASQFFVHLTSSLWLSLVFSFPFIIYQLFKFIQPALHPNEQKNTKRVFFFGNFLFYLGLMTGYFILFPLTLKFLAGYQLSAFVEQSVSLDSYMSTFITVCFFMGVVFELPIVAWFLSQIGILQREFFNKYRRHAFFAIFVLVTIFSPTGDPLTILMFFIPIYMLWELSAFVVKKETR